MLERGQWDAVDTLQALEQGKVFPIAQPGHLTGAWSLSEPQRPTLCDGSPGPCAAELGMTFMLSTWLAY